jgi:hypothetical protein
MVWRISDNLRHPGSFRKVDLVPVLLGNGIPFFANPPVALEGPPGHRRCRRHPPALPPEVHAWMNRASHTRLRRHESFNRKALKMENKGAIESGGAGNSARDPVALIARRMRP